MTATYDCEVNWLPTRLGVFPASGHQFGDCQKAIKHATEQAASARAIERECCARFRPGTNAEGR